MTRYRRSPRRRSSTESRSAQGNHGHRVAHFPQHRVGHLYRRRCIGQQGGDRSTVQGGGHVEAHRRPQGRHAGCGPDDAAPNGRTSVRRHRQVRHVLVEGDPDRRVCPEPRSVQPGAGHVRRRSVQHVRLHRMRHRLCRNACRAACRTRHCRPRSGDLRGGAVRRARSTGPRREPSRSDLHPQRRTVFRIHRRSQQADPRWLHVQR